MKYAAIDIGSNAVRLLIADIITTENTTSFTKNTLLRVPVRLGDDAFIEKKISIKKASDLVNTMQAFRLLMNVHRVERYKACATSAIREATNGNEIISQISVEAGLDVEIVDGNKEASIIYAAHLSRLLDRRKTYLYIDVGGGSTELSFFSENEWVASHSFNLGTIRILDNRDTDEEWNRMKKFIRCFTNSYKSVTGIGTGGNINKLFKLSGEKEGAALYYNQLKMLNEYIQSFSLKDRISILGLKSDRADVIVPACEIFLKVMKWSNIKEILVPKVGVADGLIQLLIDEGLGKSISHKTFFKN